MIQDMLSARQIEQDEHPSVEVTRQAIIDVLVTHHVIGARETVDRLIAAVRAENDTTAGQCLICRAVYPSGGQHAGTTFAMSISGRGICKRCVGAARDARRAAEEPLKQLLAEARQTYLDKDESS